MNQLKQPSGTLTNDNTEKVKLLNTLRVFFETEGPGPLPELRDRNFASALSTIEIKTENINP